MIANTDGRAAYVFAKVSRGWTERNLGSNDAPPNSAASLSPSGARVTGARANSCLAIALESAAPRRDQRGQRSVR